LLEDIEIPEEQLAIESVLKQDETTHYLAESDKRRFWIRSLWTQENRMMMTMKTLVIGQKS
jgi:hypothetical protein